MSSHPTTLFDFGVKMGADTNAFGTVSARARFGFAGALFKVGAKIRWMAVGSIHRPRRLRFDELSEWQKDDYSKWMERFHSGRSQTTPVLPYRTSRPGDPPLSPTGIFAETIQFAVERDESRVVVGPDAGHKKESTAPVPSVLEFGGDTMTSHTVFGRKVHVEARPYMRPAMESVSRKMVDLFEGIL